MKVMIEKLKVIPMLVGFILVISGPAPAQQVPFTNDRGEISPAEALIRYEKRIQTETRQFEKFYLTMRIAPTAFAAGDYDKAKMYAHSLLEQNKTFGDSWNDGNAIHVANLVLGLVALNAGDVTEAKRFLLEAGKTPGSPPLNSFGPNMLLAKALLARGEKEVVVQYFDLCASFWELGHDELESWKAIVVKGGIPNFRANLVYQFKPWTHEDWGKQ